MKKKFLKKKDGQPHVQSVLDLNLYTSSVTCADFNFDNYSLITYDFFKDLNEDIKEEPASPESETCNAGMDSDRSLFRNSHVQLGFYMF